MDAFYTFLADDGWAIASHIALSTLMALFPFLIVLTSLAGFFGSKELADQAAGLLLQIWPQQVTDALSGEIHDVLTTTRGDILTIGAVLAVYFASNGVEALRVALNRAYAVIEPRRWYWLRLESIGYTLVARFSLSATNSRKPMKPCGPCPRLYIASFEPSRRSTDAVASIRPSIGIRSGSLWPPTKLYFGNPPKRGDGSGSPLAKREVRSNAALMIVSSPVGVLRQKLAWR